MTTPNTDLVSQIAVALYNNAEYYGPEDVQPGWECLGDEEREEWRLIAAAALPIVAEAVKRGQAEALRDAADSVHDNAASPHCLPCHRDDADLLHTIADQIERETTR